MAQFKKWQKVLVQPTERNSYRFEANADGNIIGEVITNKARTDISTLGMKDPVEVQLMRKIIKRGLAVYTIERDELTAL